MGCSAAFWIGAACDVLTCSPSSMVGSVGVISSYVDSSAAMQSAGLKQHIFRKPGLKAAGSGNEALSTDQIDSINRGLDAAYQMFRTFVEKRRPRATGEAYSGEAWLGAAALRLRLVDSVATAHSTRSQASTSTPAGARSEWDASAEIRSEFRRFSTFEAYRRAEASGRIR